MQGALHVITFTGILVVVLYFGGGCSGSGRGVG